MRYLSLLPALATLISAPVNAQSYYVDCADNTGDSASIILTEAIVPTIDGVPLVENSEIAVYSRDGICAGMAIWKGVSLSITAWGDDIMTSVQDGYDPEEVMSIRVWDASSGIEYGIEDRSITVEYDGSADFLRSDGRYSSDAIYSLVTLVAESGPSLEAPTAPAVMFPTDGMSDVDPGVGFEWLKTKDASSYHVQIMFEEQADSARIVVDSMSVQGTTLFAELDGGSSYSWRVRAAVDGRSSAWSPLASFETRERENSSPDDSLLPDTPELDQNYPNPFNPQTTIPFVLPEAGRARLTVYDILGKEVAVLVEDKLEKGKHEIRWNAGDTPSGVFTYVLRTSTTTLRRSLVLVK